VQPGVPGQYQVVALIRGVGAAGEAFERTTSASFAVNPVQARFSRGYSDRGIDTNSDNLFDEIGVSPTVNVLTPGRYRFAVTLQASNGASLTSSKISNLQAGLSSQEVLFSAEEILDALAVNGPYGVKELRLELLDTDPLITADVARDLGPTKPYLLGQLQRPAIEVVGGIDTGIDVTGNGKFDFLDVSLSVDILYGGFYSWSARLVDLGGVELGLAAGGGVLSAGTGNLSLRFNGNGIGSNGVNGPYFVKNLIVFGGGRSISVDNAFTTQSYSASQFEGFVNTGPPKVCDVNGDGAIDRNDIAAILLARNTAAKPGDPRDANGDGIISVEDARLCALACTNSQCAP
jgi:hypothetical protein